MWPRYYESCATEIYNCRLFQDKLACLLEQEVHSEEESHVRSHATTIALVSSLAKKGNSCRSDPEDFGCFEIQNKYVWY